MIDKTTGWVEADITINGKTLSFAESMTLRVAITSFLMQVVSKENARLLGPISGGYRENLMTIEAKIRNVD